MKILLICRFMTGFENSVKEGAWNPTGSPAIYKLINRLDQSTDELKLIFTDKDEKEKSIQYKNDIVLKLKGLSTSITLLAGPQKISAFFGKLRRYISEFRQIFKTFGILFSYKPDVVYIDRSNILIAAMIARFTRVPVVLRLLGVTPAMQELITRPAFSHYLYRWAYRSHFFHVVCTKDGSPADLWMDRSLSSKSQRVIWLNGVDTKPIVREESEKIQIIILGRLDPLKRSEQCIDAILALPERILNKIEVTIIGTGILEALLKAKVSNSIFEDCISFLGAVRHDVVNTYLAKGNIYISLNAQGNLSNANQEAVKAGLCFILPEPDVASGIDKDTKQIIPENAAIYVDQNNLIENVTATLLSLIDNPDLIAQRQVAMLEAAKQLPSSVERIEREHQLLKTITPSP